jgi:signal transduction histidine kinase
MKKHIINWFVLFLFGVAYSQNISHKEKVINDCNKINNEIHQGEYVKTMVKAKSLYKLYLIQKDTFGEFMARNLMGNIYLRKDEKTLAKKILLEDQKKIVSMKNSLLKDSLMIRNLNSIGDIEQENDELIKASEKFTNSLQIAMKIHDSSYISNNASDLASVYIQLSSYQNAKKYLNLSIKYDKSQESKQYFYTSLGNIGYFEKDFKNAKKYYEKASYLIAKNDYDLLKDSYTNLGAVCIFLGDFKKAHEYMIKSYHLKKKVNAPKRDIAEAILNLSTSFVMIKDYKKSIEYMIKCDSMTKDIPSVDYRKALYHSFYLNYKDISDFKNAIKYAEKYMIYKDSMINLENLTIVQNLKVKYETDIKDGQIKSQQLNIETLNRNKKIISCGLIILLILLTTTLILYGQKSRTQKTLLRKQEELASEKINNLIENQKVKIFQSFVEGQNKERERIAKDLHDNISGNLAAIKLRMSQIKNQTGEIQQILTNLDNTYDEVRTISHDLIPKKLSVNNFSGRIEQLVDFNNSSNLSITLDLFPINELNKLPNKIQLETYSIIQETLTNMHKHSKANKGFVTITLHNNYINILIEDNGIGLFNDNVNEGIGIKNIKSRIELLKGNFNIDSKNQVGTTININLPV